MRAAVWVFAFAAVAGGAVWFLVSRRSDAGTERLLADLTADIDRGGAADLGRAQAVGRRLAFSSPRDRDAAAHWAFASAMLAADYGVDTSRYQAKVVMNIGSTYQVPDDSQVRVGSEGLLGASYLQIQPGGSDTFLKPGEAIEFTQGTLDIFSLISQAITSMAGNKAAGAGQAPVPDAPSNQPATTSPH